MFGLQKDSDAVGPEGYVPAALRTCLYCKRAFPENDVVEAWPYARRVAYDPAKQRYWAVCLKCGKWSLTALEDDERAATVEQLERWWRSSSTRYSTGGIGLGEFSPTFSVVRVGESNWKEFAHWRHASVLRKRYRRHVAGTAGMLGAVGVMFATGWLNWGGAAAIGAMSLYDAPYWGNALCRIPGSGGKRILFRAKHLRNAELARGTSSWSLNVQHNDGLTALSGADGIRALSYLLPVYNRTGMRSSVIADAVEFVSRSGGPDAVAEQAAEAAWAEQGDRATRLVKYPAVARAALEMASQEHVERSHLESELALLRAEWIEAEEIAHLARSL